MSLEGIHIAARASGCLTTLREVSVPATPTLAAKEPAAGFAPDTAAGPAPPREPIDFASLSIAPWSSAPWTPPPPSPPRDRSPEPEVPREPIDFAALSIAPYDTARKGGRKRRWLAKHEDLYDISREELAERLAAWRASRRAPQRQRGELTNRHRVAMAMEKGEWYTSPDIEHLADMPLNVVTATLRDMIKWPHLYLERVEYRKAEAPYLVPAPYGRGGQTLRTPARWLYRLTAAGEDLKLEGQEFAARAALA